MPASSTVSSFSKTKDTQRTSHTPSKQDIDHDESTEAPEEPLAPPQVPAAPINRRVRPLSETRSYHSIFSSVRGSNRNAVKTLPFRVRAQDREDKEEKQEKIFTTQPPVEETTTTEVVPETKEPDNYVSPESEDELGYEEKALTTETPSLKILTASPTKPSFNHPKPPANRPIKIRVHQKPISKTGSSTSSSSSSSSSSSFPSTSSSSSSSSHIQESAAGRKDDVASTVSQSKNDKPSITHNEPSTPVEKETNSQQTEATPVGRGSALAGRTSGLGFGSRYVNSRRYPGILLRGNSTRMLNGYKFPITSRSNLPSRTLDQARLNTHSSATSQSTLPEGSQNHKTSHTSATSTSNSGRDSNSQASSDAFNFDKSQSTSESRSHGSTTYHISDINSSSSQSGSEQPSSTDELDSSKSTSHRTSHSSATAHDTHNSQSSHISPEQDTNQDTKNKNTAEDPTSSSKTQTEEEQKRKNQEKDTSTKENHVISRTRISTSFAERFPWLASRYPGRFSQGTRPSSPRQIPRTSSSVGANRPILRETPTRVSGATGAAGVSFIQETSEDVRTPLSHDSLKNGVGAGSGKLSLNNQNTESSNNRNPTASSSSSSASSSASTSSSSHQSTSGHRDSIEPRLVGTFSNNNKDHNKDYTNERSTEITGKNDKVTDSRVALKNPAISGADPDRNGEDNDSVDTSETRIRSGTSSVVSPNHRKPGIGVNGRIRSSPTNRQFGGSRFSVKPKPAQNSRLGSSSSDSSSLSSDSLSSSNLPQSVLTSNRDAGTGTTAAKTGGLTESNSQSASSSSSSSSRDSFRGLGVRTRYPAIRGKPTNGGALKPGNGNGKVSS